MLLLTILKKLIYFSGIQLLLYCWHSIFYNNFSSCLFIHWTKICFLLNVFLPLNALHNWWPLRHHCMVRTDTVTDRVCPSRDVHISILTFFFAFPCADVSFNRLKTSVTRSANIVSCVLGFAMWLCLPATHLGHNSHNTSFVCDTSFVLCIHTIKLKLQKWNFNARIQNRTKQGLLYHRTCKRDFLCCWRSLNSYLK